MQLKKKKEKSDKTLAALSQAWRPSEQDLDQELITQEERECMREIGLKLDSSLVLGKKKLLLLLFSPLASSCSYHKKMFFKTLGILKLFILALLLWMYF